MRSLLTMAKNSCALAIIVGAVGCSSTPAVREFQTPLAAADELISATKSAKSDQLDAILGPDADAILSSGDPVQDANERNAFLAAYEKSHRIETKTDTTATLLVGDDGWPFPIPLIKTDHGWVFDAEQGRIEIQNRRIGRNELATIQTCLAIVDAQADYRDLAPNTAHAYATKFISDTGKTNGLYWPVAEGQPLSPLGELAAAAADEGYTHADPAAGPRPYHGYCFRMLTAQGASAAGGAADYLVDGQLTLGFAAIAWPAEYGRSGIMTFIVSNRGIVYERDLGDTTPTDVEAIKAFDPGPEWKATED